MPTYAGPTLPTAIAASKALGTAASGEQTAYFANGCFWGTEVRCSC